MILPGPGRVLIMLACLCVTQAWGADAERPQAKKRWRVSIVALAVASALDFSSSVGRYESNPLMRDASGRFSVGRGVAIKSGVMAGVLVTQILAMRGQRDPAIERTATLANFGAAAALTTISIRNRTIPR
jgi:hypothetical protein